MRARERRWIPANPWKTVPSALRLQPRAVGDRVSTGVPASVRDTLDTPGRPLDAGTRRFMEPRFGQDFSAVRVHNNVEAARSARDVNALAYTTGNAIAFAPGQYAPESSRGRQLIAHELAHVVQQRRGPAPQTDSISQPGDRDEMAADRASTAVLAGDAPVPDVAGAGHALQRDAAGPPSATALPPGAGPAKLPEPRKGEDEAAAEALKRALEGFGKTKLGQELEAWGKEYVLSVKGIPFDLLVIGAVANIIAANDPKIPSLPAIPIAEGVELKIDYSGRASDLPPLLRDMVTGGHESHQPGKPETKLAVSVGFTFEAFADFAKAVGRFFAKAAVWFARGVVKIGTVIGKRLGIIKRELIGALAGGALGAAMGGLAAGGRGALVGGAIGAGVGLAIGGIAHLLDRQRNK
jgi:hypothetical protein